MNFLNIINSGVVLWDGAMGTILQEDGIRKGKAPEILNLDNPEKVKEVHLKYLEAGAMGVTANTFGANGEKLSEWGLKNSVYEINAKGASIAADACKGSAFIAGSVGPTGKFVKPMGELAFTRAVEIFQEQVRGLVDGGAHIIKIETMMDIRELKAAIMASRNVCSLPVIAMMTFQQDLRTLLGSTLEAFGVVAEGAGADVVGINCSVGPARMVEMLSILSTVVTIPIIGQPNAGIPVLKEGKTHFPMGPEEFSAKARDFLPLGVRVLAGCCGTTPAHIRELRQSLGYKAQRGVEALQAPERAIIPVKGLKVASRSRVVNIVSGGSLSIVGERINPTGKKEFSRSLKSGSMDLIIKEAREQEEKGAHVLDVNVGAAGVDEERLMEEAIYSVNLNSSLPVMVDSANPGAIRRGLISVDGLPIVNSVTGERKKLDSLLPVVKEFGAALICLLFDDKGIPETAEGRLKVALKIVKEAEKAGIGRERLIMDCLTTTVSSSSKAPICALDTLSLVKKELGTPVILGVSNVSFGMPERRLINRAFLSMAALRGLDLAIINPHDVEMVNTVYASNLLCGKDPGGNEFIPRFSEQEGTGVADVGKEEKYPEIVEAVKNGDRGGVVAAIEKELSAGADPMELNNEGVVKGLEEVGVLFDSSRLFLPQVMASAEAAKAGFAEIRKVLGAEGEETMGKILLATVEGDIHDIGKNIVATLLSNHGFHVIDMGKNVSAEAILKEAKEQQVDVVGLSALMTTTMVEMRKVLKLLRENGVDVVSIVGGAVVTEEFADEIGSLLYARDAMDGVRKLKEAVSIRRKGKC